MTRRNSKRLMTLLRGPAGRRIKRGGRFRLSAALRRRILGHASSWRWGSKKRATGAFTLLELLVGLMISTMILGAAAGVFVTTMNSWEQGSQAQKVQQAGETIAGLIERHLRAAMPPENNQNAIFWGEDLTDGDVAGQRLIMISTLQTRFPRQAPPTDASEVEFLFDPAGGQAMTMRIDSSPDELPDEGGYSLELSSLVKSFQVLYFDGVQWVTEWSESTLPQAVEFRLTLSEGPPPAAAGESTGVQPYTWSISRLVAMPLAKSTGATASGMDRPITGSETDAASPGEAGSAASPEAAP